MPTQIVTDPKRQIADALKFARDARHSGDCRCFQHRDTSREAFCSDREALWSRAIDKLIDACRDRR